MSLYGDPRLPDRFWIKVAVTESECWQWTGYVAPGGYGRFGVDGTIRVAHRHAFSVLVQEVPAGRELDHTCHDPIRCQLGDACPHRRCVNPDHLKLATPGENGGPDRAYRPLSARTTCPQGHPYDRIRYHPDGRVAHRGCSVCVNARKRTPEARALRTARRHLALKTMASTTNERQSS
jgi:Zn ribbon nucleic-acid-binding protein